ncbi:MAG: CHASE2 domain-containing protein [Leptolyngbyaceae bacterium]|nr:CHASE2 domain-containing protein [Leptolyngbyaceae bacterium]
MQGTLLNQRYRIIKILGAGGFGQTYLANDMQEPQNSPCVVKQFKPVSKDETFLKVARRLFDTEAKILERLGQHELIPTFIDAFEEREEFYLVQEFVDGSSLSDSFADGLQFDEPQAIAFLRDVLSVLDFVHRNDVIHRDVKPENLIKRHRDGRYVLIDFGAVKEKQYQLVNQTQMTNLAGRGDSQSHSSLTVGIGTEGYTPHEQLSGRPRHSSDIYALGITVLQGLTGMQPFEWGDDPDTGELQWQSHTLTSVGFTLILETMVRFNVKHRYRNASDVLSDLDKLALLPDEYTTIPDSIGRVSARETGQGRTSSFSEAETGLLAQKIKPSGPKPKSRWSRFKPLAVIGLATAVMGGGLLGVRQMGWLQTLELATYDRLVQLRSNFGIDPRLLLVEITEQDLQTLQRVTPSDADLTQVLQLLAAYHPRVIGVALHRDLPQGPPEEHTLLIEQMKQSEAITITFLGNDDSQIPPPQGIPAAQIGFNDLTTDTDGVLRRSVLIGRYSDGSVANSFAFQLATRYLASDNIIADANPNDPEQMRLGQAPLPRLTPNAGQYHNLDNAGYQIMLDYRSGNRGVQTVRFTDVLNGNINPSWVTDNIVMIGTTATSTRDRFLTPYSANLEGVESDGKMPGVVVHAQMVSQLLDLANGERLPRWYWPEAVEVIWILGWAIAGGTLAYYCRHPILLGSGGIALVVIISGASYTAFGQGGWIPTLTPCLVTLLAGGSTVAVQAYLTQRRQDLISDFLSKSHLRHTVTHGDSDLPLS